MFSKSPILLDYTMASAYTLHLNWSQLPPLLQVLLSVQIEESNSALLFRSTKLSRQVTMIVDVMQTPLAKNSHRWSLWRSNKSSMNINWLKWKFMSRADNILTFSCNTNFLFFFFLFNKCVHVFGLFLYIYIIGLFISWALIYCLIKGDLFCFT